MERAGSQQQQTTGDRSKAGRYVLTRALDEEMEGQLELAVGRPGSRKAVLFYGTESY